MVDIESLRSRLEAVRAEIAGACARSGRSLSTVRLVGVTKTLPAEVVQAALDLGLEDFGENYIQELTSKAAALPPVRWHFIGHLQRNKAAAAAQYASFVHSLDSLELIKTLDRRLGMVGRTCSGLIQVHLGGEESKSGLEIPEVLPLLDALAQEPVRNLRLVGLMSVPPPVQHPDDNRPYFRQLRALLQQITERGYDFWQGQELSMGMSDDYAVAIEEGATMVRVGRSIFGARPPKAAH